MFLLLAFLLLIGISSILVNEGNKLKYFLQSGGNVVCKYRKDEGQPCERFNDCKTSRCFEKKCSWSYKPPKSGCYCDEECMSKKCYFSDYYQTNVCW